MLASFHVFGHGLPTWAETAHYLYVQIARFYDTELLRWEWSSLIVFLVLCTHSLLLPSRWLKNARVRIHAYAQNRGRAVWTCILVPTLLRVILLPLVPIKPPSVHDEFSLLLLSDTLRSGRLTNPTHPFWQHFETIHVFQQPTYQSMYPPGFGVFLALGQLLGNPWIGVLITVGLMCGALCWMLQAWLPPAWAFGGALLASIQIGFGTYWMNSYVGGAPVPAMAGALLFGALPRFFRKPTRKTAMLFAVGVLFLVNTRPFEGTILSAIAFGLALARYRSSSAETKSAIRMSVFAPAVLVLAGGAAFTMYYSWRVTHNPFKNPYVANREQYGWPENLAILPPLKLQYRHKILENMEALEAGRRSRYTTLGRMLDNWSARAAILWEFYVGPGLTLALVALPWTLRSRKSRTFFAIAVVMLLLNTLQLMAYPQHLSPETCIFYFLLIAGLRQLYVWAKRRSIVPERLISAMLLCVVCASILNLCMEQFGIRPGSFWEWPHWQFGGARAAVVDKLRSIPGKHLVFVRYRSGHVAHEEWVYNSANINKSRIVWANMMGYDKDRALREYFADRQAWIVSPDDDPYGFLPFTRKTYNPELPQECVCKSAVSTTATTAVR